MDGYPKKIMQGVPGFDGIFMVAFLFFSQFSLAISGWLDDIEIQMRRS